MLSTLLLVLVLGVNFSPALAFAFTKQQMLVAGIQSSSTGTCTSRRYQTTMGASSKDSYQVPAEEVTSLASSFSVHISTPCPNNFVWELVPLPTITDEAEGNARSAGVGALALAALLESRLESSTEVAYALNCTLNASRDAIQINVSTTANNGSEYECDDQDFLLGILSRIIIQWAAVQSTDVSSEASGTKAIDVVFDIPGSKFGGKLSLVADELLGNNPINLFDGIIENASNLEMSEMVDSMGKKLGAIPRPLVHKLNLLHRGIGMVVCKGQHITQDMPHESLPDIYCHQRTDSKRVFPSLYDMFVGGVSTAGEDARLTASREVAEELGLARALGDPKGDALAGPLFQCTVCTSYNRCVVSMFTYQCMDDEIIKWQKEEVQWGDWVSYTDVETSAILSINRLKEKGAWPGSGQDTDNTPIEIDGASGFEGETWDYVPDGLLVWEAWTRWREEKRRK